MTRGPPGNFSDRFHYRSIQTKIGEALRTRLVPAEPASDQILKALQELDRQQEDYETREKRDGHTQDAPAMKRAPSMLPRATSAPSTRI
jgi:hypothetical protein